VQLGRQLDAGGAGADDGDLQLPFAARAGLRVGADAGVDQSAMEARRLLRRVEPERVLRTPGVPKSLVWLPTAMTSVS